MRLARFQTDHRDDFVVSDADGSWYSLARFGARATADVIERWEEVCVALAAGELPGVDVPEESLLSPVHRPSKIIAIGLNYQEHVDEAGVETPPAPVAFAKFPSSLTGPFADVSIPPELTAQPDYEVELAVVIGRRTHRVSAAEAVDAVFGYAVANDVSARDHQFADGQWDRSKSFDTFCPIGPWITTADEVPDIQELGLRASVNGELRQDASTAQMIHPVGELIHYLSRGMTLEPGDVILTGTPSGVGLGFDPPRYLADDDVVVCEIERLGAVRNRMVAAPLAPVTERAGVGAGVA